MADTLDLITLNEGKAAINLPTSNTSYDTELAMFITAISRRVDSLIGPVVNRTITAERHNGGGWFVDLRKTPVSSVTTVVEWDEAGTSTSLSAEDDDTKPASGFLLVNSLHRQGRIVRRSAGTTAAFLCGTGNVVVTYVAGRAAATANVDALYKMGAGNILRRVWQRESAGWQRTDDFGEAVTEVGFYRAIDPMVREWFSDDMPAPFVA